MPRVVPKDCFDVAVVGGGIAGLSAAWHLARTGKSVALLDSGVCLAGASFDSTAILSHDPDCEWDEVEKHFGLSGARDLWRFGEEGIAALLAYAGRAPAPFLGKRHFSRVYALTSAEEKRLADLAALYKRVGASVKVRGPSAGGPSGIRAMLEIAGEGLTNNQAILKNLKRSFARAGGRLVMQAPVSRFVREADGSWRIASERGELRAGLIVIASGGGDPFPGLAKLVKRVRTFVVTFEQKGGVDRFYRNGALWDTHDPYHYVRSFRGRLLWVGGADISDARYEPRRDKEYFESVRRYAREVLGLPASYREGTKWSGVFFRTAMGVPFIDALPGGGGFAAYGFGGTGIALSFASGALVRDLVAGKKPAVARLFSFGR